LLIIGYNAYAPDTFTVFPGGLPPHANGAEAAVPRAATVNHVAAFIRRARFEFSRWRRTITSS
jgi:hypothetical protein